MRFLVLDTNIPLTDANAILTLGNQENTTIVIPETVLAELDNKKSGFDEVNWQARGMEDVVEAIITQIERTLNKVDIELSISDMDDIRELLDSILERYEE